MTREEVMEIQRTTDINYSPYYDVIPALINERDYKSGIEIGVFAGGQSKSILDKTNLKILLGIDPYRKYTQCGINGMGTITQQEDFDIMCELALTRLDRQRFWISRMTSDEALYPVIKSIQRWHEEKVFDRNQVDFVFFDGLHEARQLQKDIDNYVPLIRKGGACIFHDYNHPTFPDLTPVIDNFAKEHNSVLNIEPLHLVYVDKTWD